MFSEKCFVVCVVLFFFQEKLVILKITKLTMLSGHPFGKNVN